MKILFITEAFPYPLDTGGNVRTYQILKGLAAEHDVTLLATSEASLPLEHLAPIHALCSQTIVVAAGHRGPLHELRTMVTARFRQHAYLLARHYSPQMASAIGQLTEQADVPFDAVHFNHLDAALYEPLVPKDCLRILDTHNVVTRQMTSQAASEQQALKRWAIQRDLSKLEAAEVALCNKMDLSLVCSDDDAQAMRELGITSHLSVVPNGVDLTFFHPRCRPVGSEPVLCFVGTLDYDPCEIGVWHFANDILPLIREQRPDTRFLVVGRNPSSRLQALAKKDPAIELTGRVEDIRPSLWRGQVAVVPLLSGSGTRLKILEAMAAGIPVVSTLIGAEGLPIKSGHHGVLADGPAEFAAATLALMDDGSRRDRMAMAARELVEQRFGWPAIVGSFCNELDTLLKERPRLASLANGFHYEESKDEQPIR